MAEPVIRTLCPGALQDCTGHADGATGQDPAAGRDDRRDAQLEALAHAAHPMPAPRAMELTSRGNIQIRGVATTRRALADAVAAAVPCCRRRRTSGCATSSPHRCRAARRHRRRARTRCRRSTPRSARTDAGSRPAGPVLVRPSTTVAATSPAWAPTSARTLSANPPSPFCWPAATPACGSRPPTSWPALISIARRFVEIRGKCLARSRTRRSLDAARRPCADPPTPGATWPPVTRPPVGWIEPGRRPRRAGRRRAARCPAGAGRRIPGRVDAPMVVTPWRSVLRLRPRRGRRRRRAAGARADGPGLRRRLAVAAMSAPAPAAPAASTPPPTSAPTPRRAVDDADRGGAPALRRLRAGLRQPARR